jgi:hypothetical protein
MKKIITLFFCTALFATSFAQSGGRNWDNRNSNNQSPRNRDYQLDQDRDGIPDKYDKNNRNTTYQNNGYSIAQRNMQIQRITRQYDRQIQQVNYDRSLSRREKKNAIKALESQKIYEINRINAAYNSSVYNNRNKNYDHDNRYER